VRAGDFEILPVLDGRLMVPPALMYENVSESDWAPHRQLLDENGMIQMDVGGFLVRDGDRKILIDIGVGFVERLPEFGGKYLESLAALGQQPDDITDVLFTHLHFDHIGWASRESKPVFPNATYRCHAKDWDYFVTRALPQHAMAQMVGLPMATDAWLDGVEDRFELWDGDGNVLPGIDVRDAPGHTDGSTVIVISSGTQRAVILGDAVHCPVELLEPEWALIGDVDPALAKRTREALAREYEGTDIPLSAPHFPGMQFGRLLPAQGRTQWVFD